MRSYPTNKAETMQFQLISSDNLFKLNVMVQEKLNSGWVLYGSPSVAIAIPPTSAKLQKEIYAQAVTKISEADPIPEPAATSDDNPAEEEGNKATFVYESPDDGPDHLKEVKVEKSEPTPEPAAASEIKEPAPKKPTADDAMEASIVDMARKTKSIKIEEPVESPKVEVNVDTNLPKEDEKVEVPTEKVAVEVTA